MVLASGRDASASDTNFEVQEHDSMQGSEGVCVAAAGMGAADTGRHYIPARLLVQPSNCLYLSRARV